MMVFKGKFALSNVSTVIRSTEIVLNHEPNHLEVQYKDNNGNLKIKGYLAKTIDDYTLEIED